MDLAEDLSLEITAAEATVFLDEAESVVEPTTTEQIQTFIETHKPENAEPASIELIEQHIDEQSVEATVIQLLEIKLDPEQQLPPPVKDAVKRLVEVLPEDVDNITTADILDNPQVVEALHELLVSLGYTKSIEQLQSALESADEEVLITALMHLANLQVDHQWHEYLITAQNRPPAQDGSLPARLGNLLLGLLLSPQPQAN